MLGTLKFDELMIFGLQLTDYRNFDKIVKRIEKFQIEKKKTAKKYREFKYYYQLEALKEIYKSEISKGETSTRESNIATAKKFLQTKASNMHDYADACIRYLRATGLVSISHIGRSLSILPEGNIKANLKFDDFGNPMSTAQGNMANIVCDYENFGLTVEVTMASGQKQYEMEGEPVSRHLAKYKKETEKEAYCLFVAPTINEACIAHFYGLHNLNISYYDGKSVIVPLPLKVVKKMLEDSFKASYTPNPEQVRYFFE